MLHTTDHKSRLVVRRWLFGAAILALLVGAACLMIRPLQHSPFPHDRRFVATTRPPIVLPPNATLRQRAFTWWLQIRQRFQKPRPLAYSFPASPTNRCSIHGLFQCTEVTGVRYVIARDVAGWSIQFGHTNTLNGVQWVMAFTEALRTGEPEWWDSQINRFRKENLVLLTNDARTVLVIPKEMAREFQSRRVN